MDKFDEEILALTEEFRNSLTKEDDQLVQKFKDYLYNLLNLIRENKDQFPEEDEITEIVILRNMAKSIIKLENDENKKRAFLYDENFEQIRMTSGRVFKIASEMIMQNKQEAQDVDVSKEIKEMEELIDGVEDWNKEQAKMLLSEASLDAEFIKNPSTDIYSLRLYKVKKRINEMEER